MPKRTKTARLTRWQLRALAHLVWAEGFASKSWRREYDRLVQLGLATRQPLDGVLDYRPTPAGRAHVRRCCEVGL